MAAAKRKKTQRLKAAEKQVVAVFQERWRQAQEAMLPHHTYWREMQAVYDGIDELPQELKDRLEVETRVPWAWWN